MNDIVKRLRKLSLNLKVTGFADGLDQLDEDIDVIEKIFDKATPKKAKPMYLPLVSTPYRCPCCGTLVRSEIEKFNYCHNCGQAIDWSDEDVEQRKM